MVSQGIPVTFCRIAEIFVVSTKLFQLCAGGQQPL